MADCGDVTALPGLTEMITTYVILSRVRKADNLLLMRAFSPYLFRLGSAPGPHCLLKLLRHRFSGAAQEACTRASATGSNADGEQYAPEQAMDDYRALAAMWEEQKKAAENSGYGMAMFFMRTSFSRRRIRRCRDGGTKA